MARSDWHKVNNRWVRKTARPNTRRKARKSRGGRRKNFHVQTSRLRNSGRRSSSSRSSRKSGRGRGRGR